MPLTNLIAALARVQEWMRNREVEKEALAMELLCGKLSKEEELFLRVQIVEKVEMAKSLQTANEESNKQFLAMEEAFSQLKQVTGVSSLVDMHEKFSSQKGNKLSLLQEVRDAEARLEAIKAAHDSAVQEAQSSYSATRATSISLLSSTAISSSLCSSSSSSDTSTSSSQPALTIALALAISSIGSPRPPMSPQREGDLMSMARSLSLTHEAVQTQGPEEFSREENNK